MTTKIGRTREIVAEKSLQIRKLLKVAVGLRVRSRTDNHNIWDFSREFSPPWVQKAKQWPNPGKRLSVASTGMTGFPMLVPLV
jgi:hypothetical protein